MRSTRYRGGSSSTPAVCPANIFSQAAIGIALSQIFEQSGTEVDVGVSVTPGPITFTDEQTPGIELSHYLVGDTLNEEEVGVELSQMLTLEGDSTEQTTGYEILRTALTLVRESGGDSASQIAVSGRTDWQNINNATGKNDGTDATIAGNLTQSRGGRLNLDYAPFTNKHHLIIDQVLLHFYTSQSGTLLNNGDFRHTWRRGGPGPGIGVITLATFTGDQDSMATPATYDITADIGSWADLEGLHADVFFFAEAAELQTAAVDAVEIEIHAHLLFDPADVPGLAAWYRADAIGATLLNAAAVATWDNLEGTAARDMTQATVADRPTIRHNVINGKPVVRFDATDFMENATAFLTGSAGSIFAVVRLSTVVGDHQILSSADEASNTRYVYARVNGDRIQLGQQNNDTADSVASPAASVGTATNYILEFHSDGSAYEIRINGVVQALTVVAGADNGDWYADASARDNVVLGAIKVLAGTVTKFSSDMAEVIVYDGVTLTDIEKQRIREWYLSDKYGIAV